MVWGACTRNCASALMVPLSVEPKRKLAEDAALFLSGSFA